MRLWSLHPSNLDTKGLVALWREALLAQAVLSDKTKGYKQHSQLVRFKAMPKPLEAIGAYLMEVHREALIRGYTFNSRLILAPNEAIKMNVTKGQLAFEFEHLRNKLIKRSNKDVAKLNTHAMLLFNVVDGPVEKWEKV